MLHMKELIPIGFDSRFSLELVDQTLLANIQEFKASWMIAGVPIRHLRIDTDEVSMAEELSGIDFATAVFAHFDDALVTLPADVSDEQLRGIMSLFEAPLPVHPYQNQHDSYHEPTFVGAKMVMASLSSPYVILEQGRNESGALATNVHYVDGLSPSLAIGCIRDKTYTVLRSACYPEAYQ